MTKAIKRAATRSWKTTTAGVAIFIGITIDAAIVPWLDELPATVTDWPALLAAFGALMAGLNARDHSVSSEAAGVEGLAE